MNPVQLAAQFGAWNRGVWPLLTQPQTKTLFNGVMTDDYGVSKTTYLCAKSGVVTGLKPRLFSGTYHTCVHSSALPSNFLPPPVV